jgi:hypothetical protein
VAACPTLGTTLASPTGSDDSVRFNFPEAVCRCQDCEDGRADDSDDGLAACCCQDCERWMAENCPEIFAIDDAGGVEIATDDMVRVLATPPPDGNQLWHEGGLSCSVAAGPDTHSSTFAAIPDSPSPTVLDSLVDSSASPVAAGPDVRGQGAEHAGNVVDNKINTPKENSPPMTIAALPGSDSEDYYEASSPCCAPGSFSKGSPTAPQKRQRTTK